MFIQGFAHPNNFTDEAIKNYLTALPVEIGMTPIGKIHLERNKEIDIGNGETCDGTFAFQLWKTSGVAIYTWDIGKISITIHTCKDFDYEWVCKHTKNFFRFTDYNDPTVILPNGFIRKITL
ncbi:MAG: hypothetical protein GTO02_22570 [Candidatus Dadabacteria bacterium]|nr:hypothetical protein [Candidatus Dadabacteria bacterium]